MKHRPEQEARLKQFIVQNQGAFGHAKFFGLMTSMPADAADSALKALSKDPNPCVVECYRGVWGFNRLYREPSSLPEPHPVTTPTTNHAVLAAV